MVAGMLVILPDVSSCMDRVCGAKKGGHRKESHFTKSVVLVPDHLAKVTLGVSMVRFFVPYKPTMPVSSSLLPKRSPEGTLCPPASGSPLHSALQPWGFLCTPLLFPLTWDIVSIPVPMSVPAFSELQCEAEATTVFTKPNCGWRSKLLIFSLEVFDKNHIKILTEKIHPKPIIREKMMSIKHKEPRGTFLPKILL